MRSLFTGLCILLLTGLTTPVFAQGQAQAPATQPAPVAAAPSDKLVVFPFAVSSDAKSPWVGKAIQQDVFTDVIQRTRARVEAVPGEPPVSTDDALHRARDTGATLAVFGDVQSTTSGMRITGQVLDVQSGAILGGLKATGRPDDLFPMEDAIAGQVLHALPAGLLVAPPQQQPQPQATTQPPVTYTQPNYQQPSYQQPASEYYSQQVPTYSNTYIYQTTPYAYDSYYPDYYYSYPYYPLYGGVFLGLGFHDHFDHHGFDHHGFDGGFRRGFSGGSFNNRGGFGGHFGGGMHAGGGFHGGAAHAGGGRR
jgi:TolB-like protein